MDRKEVSALNREAWNEVAPIHAESQFAHLLHGFRHSGFSRIPPIRRDPLLRHGISGKSIIQLCCNNGREVLSLRNMGAGRCVGIDLSDEFIKQGLQLAEAGNIDAELVCADVYELGQEYDGQFDIAYISPGSLRCLPELDTFFSVLVGLLKPGGWLFMNEMHPFINMYSMDPSQEPSEIRNSYFDPGPFTSNRGLDYYRVRAYEAKTSVRFNHTVSDFISACAGSGLVIEAMEESRADLSGGTFRNLVEKGVPISMTLTAHLPG